MKAVFRSRRLSANTMVMAVFTLMLLVSTGIALAQAEPASLNGTWALDESKSETLEQMSDAMNEKLNAEWREKRSKDKPRDDDKPKSRNRFQNQLDATEKMINEDSRSIDRGGPPEVRRILEARTIRLYQGSKVIILYDGEEKRLLTLNPAGRAYSVSGTEITHDDIGRSLTYIEENTLGIDTKLHQGGKITEHYSLGASPDTMQQALRVEAYSGGPALEFVRVFNRID